MEWNLNPLLYMDWPHKPFSSVLYLRVMKRISVLFGRHQQLQNQEWAITTLHVFIPDYRRRPQWEIKQQEAVHKGHHTAWSTWGRSSMATGSVLKSRACIVLRLASLWTAAQMQWAGSRQPPWQSWVKLCGLSPSIPSTIFSNMLGAKTLARQILVSGNSPARGVLNGTAAERTHYYHLAHKHSYHPAGRTG